MASKRVTEAFVYSINQKLTGRSVVVKANELSSALARPGWKQRYHPTASPSELAASLAYGIIQGHPFMDGNKRTAFWAANEFLKDLGTAGFTQGTVDTTNSDIAMNPIDDAHSRVAQGSLDEAGLSAVYRSALGH